MKQSEIKQLLEEGKTAHWERCLEIATEFERAFMKQVEPRLTDSIARIEVGQLETSIGSLFLKTAKEARVYLPFLFPFFAMVCGDRDPGTMFADVAWNLVDAVAGQKPQNEVGPTKVKSDLYDYAVNSAKNCLKGTGGPQNNDSPLLQGIGFALLAIALKDDHK